MKKNRHKKESLLNKRVLVKWIDSNLSERRSVLAIGKCESDGSIINTIGHELLHVVAHICEQNGIDMLSEEPCYIMGSLCEKFFKVYD